jgi:LysM repeat protein
MPRWIARAAVLVVLVSLVAGCVTTNPVPTPVPTPTSTAPTPRPEPTARFYTIRQGDTLNRIARRFDLTVGQLLTANPSITDPNLIAVGQTITIPPPGAPDTSPTNGGISDARDDFTNPDEEPVFGEGYADIDGVGVRTSGRNLVITLGLTSRPPASIDPEYESLMYTVVIDVDDDDQPEYRLKYGNDGEESGALTVSLEDRGTGTILAGDDFPGELSIKGSTITWTIDPDALGGGARWRLAAKAERTFYPGGRADPETEPTLDFAPNQQWPKPNPRWVELGAPVGSPAP